MSRARSTFVPIAVALALAFSLAIFWDSGNPVAGWSLVATAIALPFIVGAIEKDRIPEGRWWIAPVLTASIMVLISIAFVTIAVSRI